MKVFAKNHFRWLVAKFRCRDKVCNSMIMFNKKDTNKMGSIRKNYPANFEVKVALAATKDDKTLAQLANEFGVHTNQIRQWK